MAHTVLLLSVFAVCAVFSASGAGLVDISLGKCVDNKKDLNQFRMDQFLGKWYENATLNRLPYTAGRCGAVEYTLNLMEDTVHVRETEVVDDKEVEYDSTLYKINLIDYYRYFIVYEKSENLPYQQNLKLLYKLLGTDYNCWAVVYTCIGEPEIHKEIVSVLLRTRKEKCLNEATNQAVESLIKEVLSKDFLTEFSFNNHTECKVEEPVKEEEEEKAENDVTQTESPAADGKQKTEGKEKTPKKDGTEPAPVKEDKKEKTTGGEKTEDKVKTPVKEQKTDKTGETPKTPAKDKEADKTGETPKTPAKEQEAEKKEDEHPTEPAKKHKKKTTTE